MNEIVIPCCMCNKDVFVSKKHLKYRKIGPYCKNCRKIHLQDCHNKRMLLKYGTINKNEIRKIVNQEKIKINCSNCDQIIEIPKYQKYRKEIYCLSCRKERRYIKIKEKMYKKHGTTDENIILEKIKENKRKENRKYSYEKRQKEQFLVDIKCKICGKITQVKKCKEKQHLRKGGIVCKKCISEMSSIRLTNIRAKQTPERRREITKLANAGRTKESNSLAVKKQWETLRKSPEKWAEMCKKKSERMKKVWREYPDEIKNHIVNAFCKSFGKSRSTSSDLLKNKMITDGVYDGFVSEEVFHGFVPDEINHNLKVIVEMYGDLYHCNPKRYKDPKQYITVLQRTVEEQWQRDRRRLACFYKHGYSVVVVWDSDFRNYPDREIERIRNEIKRKKET